MNSPHIYNKYGTCLMKLSRKLLICRVGDRVPTVTELTEEFSLSRGTVQSALQMLEQDGSVTFSKSGHLGSFIHSIDRNRLWTHTRWVVLIGCMPLPNSRYFDGLATAINEEMSKSGVPFHFTYVQGANNRIRLLESGKCSLALSSLMTAQKAVDESDDLEIAHILHENSYSTRDVLALSVEGNRKRSLGQRLRVAIDSTSPDNVFLARHVFTERDVDFENVPYNSIPALLDECRVDAAIYNEDSLLDSKYVSHKDRIITLPLTDFVIDPSYTTAAILINRKEDGIRDIVHHTLMPSRIRTVQEAVVTGARLPHY